MRVTPVVLGGFLEPAGTTLMTPTLEVQLLLHLMPLGTWREGGRVGGEREGVTYAPILCCCHVYFTIKKSSCQ